MLFKLTVWIDILSDSYKISLWRMLPSPFDKSVLVHVMALCHQATSHCMIQCWTRSVPLNGVTRPQWVTAGSVISVILLLHFTWKYVGFITNKTLFVTYFVAWVNNYCKSQIWGVRTITCLSFYWRHEDAVTRKNFQHHWSFVRGIHRLQ